MGIKAFLRKNSAFGVYLWIAAKLHSHIQIIMGNYPIKILCVWIWIWVMVQKGSFMGDGFSPWRRGVSGLL
jgi:hypothetical protein